MCSLDPMKETINVSHNINIYLVLVHCFFTFSIISIIFIHLAKSSGTNNAIFRTYFGNFFPRGFSFFGIILSLTAFFLFFLIRDTLICVFFFYFFVIVFFFIFNCLPFVCLFSCFRLVCYYFF